MPRMVGFNFGRFVLSICWWGCSVVVGGVVLLSDVGWHAARARVLMLAPMMRGRFREDLGCGLVVG